MKSPSKSNKDQTVTGSNFRDEKRFQTGNLVWRSMVAPGFAIMSSPTVANGVVYVGSGPNASATRFDGKLYAVDAATGQVLFGDVVSLGTGEQRWVNASPTVDGGVVYIPNYSDGTVAAFGLGAQ